MKLHFIWIGKTKEQHCAGLVDEYLKRLSRFVSYEVDELKPSTGVTDETRATQLEGAKILAAIERDELVVLLDERGQSMTSVELTDFVKTKQQSGCKRIAFIVGGFAGVTEEVKKRAQLKLALSRMTLTHEFARVLLVEQLYRAYTLIEGIPYHKF